MDGNAHDVLLIGTDPVTAATIRAALAAQVTLNSIGDRVVSTDIEGKVTYLNPVAERMTGLVVRGGIRPDFFRSVPYR